MLLSFRPKYLIPEHGRQDEQLDAGGANERRQEPGVHPPRRAPEELGEEEVPDEATGEGASLYANRREEAATPFLLAQNSDVPRLTHGGSFGGRT